MPETDYEGLAYQVHEAGRQDWPKPWDQRPAAAVIRDHVEAKLAEVRAELADAIKGQALAKDEGVSETLQLIDQLTGGDGEYRFSTIEDRNCPDEAAMQAKIVARFNTAQTGRDRTIAEQAAEIEKLRYCLRFAFGYVPKPDGATDAYRSRYELARIALNKDQADAG